MTISLVHDLLIILAAGFLAALICRRLNISVLVGYLICGALLGGGVLAWITDHDHQLEHFTEIGVFLLLFSIGLEFSLEDMRKLGMRQMVGGAVQMSATAAPIAAALWWANFDPAAIGLIAAAVSFSSTVLVFKALAERGHNEQPHGRRAIGLLLFQDAALVPLLLVVPLLASGPGIDGQPSTPSISLGQVATLAAISASFVVGVFAIRELLSRYVIRFLAGYRSTDLVILFTLLVLGCITLLASALGLPAAIGAFAAGLIFNGNRWTQQIDSLVLPFRETFAAIFFVGLGLLFEPAVVLDNPIVMAAIWVAVLIVKWIAASISLRITGLKWRRSIGTGLGLAHVGEFAFVLLLVGVETGTISDLNYSQVVTLAILSLIVTPMLLQTGLRFAGDDSEEAEDDADKENERHRATVIGMGPIGRQISSQLEIMGREVTVLDSSPLNVHELATMGFLTAVGDATDVTVLRNAGVATSELVIVCVPDDIAAIGIVTAIRSINSDCRVTVRCRYQSNMKKITRAGANTVVSEEIEVSTALVRMIRGDV